MTSPNPILSTIIFVFAIQALLLGAMLLLKKPKEQSNIFLALVVLFFALMALNIALVNVLLSQDVFYAFRYVQLELLYGIGPALYFYSKSITDRKFKFQGWDYLHFVPLALEFVFYRTAFYRLGAEGLYQTPSHPYTRIYLTEQWLGILSITIYTILALKILYQHQYWLKQNYSNLEKKSLGWLKVPVIVYSFFWIGWNIITELDRFIFDRALREYYFLPTFVGLAGVSCWIGFKGYVNSKIETPGYTSKKVGASFAPIDPAVIQRITNLMQEKKPYLDPELDLAKLAALLGMKPKELSHTLNQSFSRNFYDYVNQYRVEAFKKKYVIH